MWRLLAGRSPPHHTKIELYHFSRSTGRRQQVNLDHEAGLRECGVCWASRVTEDPTKRERLSEDISFRSGATFSSPPPPAWTCHPGNTPDEDLSPGSMEARRAMPLAWF